MPRPLDLVVVHREKPDAVVETVAGVLGQGVDVRVLVVDNGSAPAALDHVRAALPDGVAVLALGANTGFGPAANAGFRWFLDRDPAPWLAVAPHDAEPRPGCLHRLLEEVAARPRAGLVSADVGDGLTPVVDPYFGAIPAPATVTDGWEPAGYPHGTLMLARRELLTEVGLFDERYFAYCEETELAIRAAAAGWEIGVVRGADVRNRDLG
ncbi:MAG TPA: glycosyltransferase, partial [Acidimicrobiales bacterium]